MTIEIPMWLVWVFLSLMLINIVLDSWKIYLMREARVLEIKIAVEKAINKALKDLKHNMAGEPH